MTPGPAVEIPGLDGLAQACPPAPSALSDEDIQALYVHWPTADERERRFWGPRDQAYRAHSLCEANKARAAVNAMTAFNEAVRGD